MNKFKSLILVAVVAIASLAQTAYAGCNDAWVRYKPYAASDIVKYSNGQNYKAKFANPGYDPTISTYYWAPYTCTVTQPPVTPPPTSTAQTWVGGKFYAAGAVVLYTPNQKYYKAKYDNNGFNPTISTYYWAPHFVAGVPSSAGQWAVIGSSTAAGSGASSLSMSWVNRVGATYANKGVSITNLARPGTVTWQGMPTSTVPPMYRPAPISMTNIDAALAWSPKVVFISYPTNDAMSGYSAAETVSNIATMRAKAMNAGATVIVQSTTPRTSSAGEQAVMRETDRLLAELAGPCFLEVRTETIDPVTGSFKAGYDSGDGVHGNDAFHALLATRNVELINSGKCVILPQ